MLSRWGQSAVFIKETNEILVYGGFGADISCKYSKNKDKIIYKKVSADSRLNTMAIYNIQLNYWKYVSTNLPKLIFHTCCRYKNALYIYGGRTNPYNLNNQMYIYNIDNQQWSIFNTINHTPRYRHSSIIYKHYMIVFGGRTIDQVHNDLLILDLHSKRWYKIDSIGDIPIARHSHQVTIVKDTMYLYGGRINTEILSSSSTQFFYMHTIKLDKLESQIKSDQDQIVLKWYKIQNPLPLAIYSHTMHYIYDKYILIIGGISTSTYSNELSHIALLYNIELQSIDNNFIINFNKTNDNNHELFTRTIFTRHSTCLLSNSSSTNDYQLISIGGGCNCFSFGSFFSPTIIMSITNKQLKIQHIYKEYSIDKQLSLSKKLPYQIRKDFYHQLLKNAKYIKKDVFIDTPYLTLHSHMLQDFLSESPMNNKIAQLYQYYHIQLKIEAIQYGKSFYTIGLLSMFQHIKQANDNDVIYVNDQELLHSFLYVYDYLHLKPMNVYHSFDIDPLIIKQYHQIQFHATTKSYQQVLLEKKEAEEMFYDYLNDFYFINSILSIIGLSLYNQIYDVHKKKKKKKKREKADILIIAKSFNNILSIILQDFITRYDLNVKVITCSSVNSANKMTKTQAIRISNALGISTLSLNSIQCFQTLLDIDIDTSSSAKANITLLLTSRC